MREKSDYEELRRRIEELEAKLATSQETEKILGESERLYRAVFESINEGVVLQESSGRILTWNPSAERIFGVSAEDVTGRTSTDLEWPTIHEDGSRFQGRDHPSMVTLRTGAPCKDVIMGVFRPDGELRWISINTRPCFKNNQKKPHAVAVSFSDITDRKRAEKEREKSERLLQAIMDNAPVLISVKDRQGVFILANKRLWDHLGAAPSELIGRSVYDLFPFETADQLMKHDLAALRSGSAVHLEETLEQHNGAVDVFHTVKFPLYLDEEELGTCAICLDITERKKAEERLIESERRFKSLTEHLPDMVARFDTELRHIYVNPAVEKLTGVSSGHFIGRTNEELGMPQDVVKLWNNRLLHTLKSGEKTVLEFDYETPDGPRCFQSIIVPDCVNGNTIESVLCVTRDITERILSEKALRRKKMELREKALKLEEANTALKVLLQHRGAELNALEENVLASVKGLIAPYLDRLQQTGLSGRQQTYVDVLKSNLNEITSSLVKQLSSPNVGLTPRELEVADLIKRGKSNDEISDLLLISVNAVSFHRKNIRKKLGLKGRKVNLRSYLYSLS